MRCALCDSPAWHGFEHDRSNWDRPEWRPAMLRAHTDQVLRMRPLPAPDPEYWTDENVNGWERLAETSPTEEGRRRDDLWNPRRRTHGG